MMRWRAVAITIALLAGGLPAFAESDNLLLITLDTTRADHLGSYGFAKAQTPNLDRLAAEGVRFERAYSHVPLTLPSHSSILTGLLPPYHGVRSNGGFHLEDSFETLATSLKKRGYRTAAFVSSFVLDRRFGLARGFDTYDDQVEEGLPEGSSLEAQRPGNKTVAALEAWLAGEGAKPGPIFVWLHLYDPHEPYRPPSPYWERFADSPYDGEIAFDDALVGSVLQSLEKRGPRSRTLVAVIGDHGESLGEHGESAHGMFLYEGSLRVPFILRYPGHLPAGKVVTEPVRETDLAPSVLDLLRLPGLPNPSGRSLVPLIEKGPVETAPPVYAETLLPQVELGFAPLRSIQDARYKLIDAPRPELYDLKEDPREANSRYEAEPAKVGAMRRELDRLTGGQWGALASLKIDAEAREKLASLGYVGGSGEPLAPSAAGRKDPKDGIAIFDGVRRASAAIRDRRFREAETIIDGIRKAQPDNPIVWLLDASAQLGLGDYKAALGRLRERPKDRGETAEIHYLTALCLAKVGTPAETLREIDATLALDARHADARVLRSRILLARGDGAGAVLDLRAAADLKPQSVIVRGLLAKALADSHRTEEAKAEYETLLKIQPDYAPGLAGLGMIRAAEANVPEATRLLKRALEVDPGQDLARFALAQVLDNVGRTAEAAAEFARLVDSLRKKLAQNPDDAEARQNLARVLDRQRRLPAPSP